MKLFRHTPLTIALLALVLCAGCREESAPAPAPEASSFEQAPTFELRSPLQYEHTYTMTQKQKYNEFAEDTVSLQLAAALRFMPTRLMGDGGAVVELTFDRLRIDVIPANGERIEFDTEVDYDETNETPYVRALRRIAESGVTYEIDANGQVIAMAGAAELVRLVQSLPGATLIAGVINEAWLRGLAEDVFGPAGGAAMRDRDEHWTTDESLTLGGFTGADTAIDWQVRSIQNDIAVMRGDGETSAPTKADPAAGGARQIVTGAVTQFEVHWDIARGRSASVEVQGAMSLEFRAQDFLLGTASLATHSLTRAAD